MNLQKIIISIIFIFLTKIIYSQDVTIHINSIDVGNGNYINECDTIDFESNENLTLNFWVSLAKTANHTADNATLTIFTKRDDNTFEEAQQAIVLTSSSWNGDTIDYNFNITLQASVFEISGGIFYAHFSEDGSQSIQTCNFPIIKDEVPTFELSPSSTSVSCNSTSSKSFSVSNVYNSPGTLQYQWSVGSGWKRNGVVVSNFTTTTNSITLTPYQYPPSNVTVTPVLDGISFPELTSTISLSGFSTTNQIVSNSLSCTSNVYSLQNPFLPTGWSVNWSLENTTIVNLTQLNNQAIVTTNSGQYGSVTINALIRNSCNQSVTISKTVHIGQPKVKDRKVYGKSNVVKFTTTSYNVDWVEGATSFHWWIHTLNTECGYSNRPKFTNTNSNDINTSSRFVSIDWSNCNGTYVVNCKAVNTCGETAISHVVVSVSDCIPNIIMNKSGSNTYTLRTDPNNPCSTISGDLFDDNNNRVEVYNTFGYQDQDIKVRGNEIKLENTQSGSIKIIRVVVGDKVIIKRIITD